MKEFRIPKKGIFHIQLTVNGKILLDEVREQRIEEKPKKWKI